MKKQRKQAKHQFSPGDVDDILVLKQKQQQLASAMPPAPRLTACDCDTIVQ
jgi:hypothetical protein